jgi:peptidoglycan/xylan/chitin deacetylase (PgdA/CDA1 family)
MFGLLLAGLCGQLRQRTRSMIRLIAIISFLAALSFSAAAEPCPGNPLALGTERVMTVDARTTPRVGRKHFPTTLPLGRKELVLTFDDGPAPETTPKVLEALARECVRATFFMLGKNAEEHPNLARRVLAEGHSVGSHTFQHPILSMVPADRAEAEINHGIEEIDYALYGQRRTQPLTPFFRFPGFASTPELLDRMAKRNIVVFGADVWASDWNPMTPEQQLELIVARIEQVSRGIVLFHDTRAQTAAMLPRFLQEMKRRGYRIVHVEPAGGRGILN